MGYATVIAAILLGAVSLLVARPRNLRSKEFVVFAIVVIALTGFIAIAGQISSDAANAKQQAMTNNLTQVANTLLDVKGKMIGQALAEADFRRGATAYELSAERGKIALESELFEVELFLRFATPKATPSFLTRLDKNLMDDADDLPKMMDALSERAKRDGIVLKSFESVKLVMDEMKADVKRTPMPTLDDVQHHATYCQFVLQGIQGITRELLAAERAAAAASQEQALHDFLQREIRKAN